jgi:hypothetical protein
MFGAIIDHWGISRGGSTTRNTHAYLSSGVQFGLKLTQSEESLLCIMDKYTRRDQKFSC